MEAQQSNRSFYTGVVIGTLLGGCVAALMSIRNTPEAQEYIVERGVELKNPAEDVVQRAQHIANDTIIRVQTNAHTTA
ncbi:MAG: hypothetical protein GFH27_549283n262 [Chloroflexi bacterium AL-W]|nr:hypothetical protein [Chloroflexi bacterium AL-N1]NOK64618.1 hypothetical protein [Chloroflexi bacterium AL-N10]NOK75859.1 hypothetical protein [Chloroflexi bacterium AL-N5]NOK80383.1 hypothetical protein [Chloroflexi bacterium AL-W]NOK86896.1 hypothetical protein [Chloroflexi bacterium AL-N15]